MIARLVGHRLLATSLLFTGDITEGRTHIDRALALYDPAEHRSLGTRLGADISAVVHFMDPWLMKVENAVKFEPVGEFALKGIRRPLAAYNVLAALT